MYTNNLKIALMATVCFLFSCSKDEIIIDDIAPKLTFDKLSKNYKSGGSFTDAEILAGIKGNKTGYTLKKITNINPNDIATVEGDKPNLSLKMKKAGRFTASIFLQHSEKPEASVIDAVFEITNVRPIMKTWEKTFGGSNDDVRTNVIPTKDGGYIMTGETMNGSSGSYFYDLLVVKTDNEGNKEWEKQFSKSPYSLTNRSIAQTQDGGYIIAVAQYNGINIYETILIKIDNKGNLQRERKYNNIYPKKIRATKDGGYILLGNRYRNLGALNYHFVMIKYDSKGDKQWVKTYEKNSIGSRSEDLVQTKDGGYIIVGNTMDTMNKIIQNHLIVKTDSNGNVQWEKEYSTSNNKMPRTIIQTTDGGYAIAGYKNITGTLSDFWVLKINDKGNKQWDKLFGGGVKNQPTSIVQTKDGGYKIVGTTNSKGAGLNDMLMIKINDKGDKQWEKTFGGKDNDYGSCIIKTTDGGYAVSGATNSKGAGGYDFWLLKLDENGDL